MRLFHEAVCCRAAESVVSELSIINTMLECAVVFACVCEDVCLNNVAFIVVTKMLCFSCDKKYVLIYIFLL